MPSRSQRRAEASRGPPQHDRFRQPAQPTAQFNILQQRLFGKTAHGVEKSAMHEYALVSGRDPRCGRTPGHRPFDHPVGPRSTIETDAEEPPPGLVQPIRQRAHDLGRQPRIRVQEPQPLAVGRTGPGGHLNPSAPGWPIRPERPSPRTGCRRRCRHPPLRSRGPCCEDRPISRRKGAASFSTGMTTVIPLRAISPPPSRQIASPCHRREGTGPRRVRHPRPGRTWRRPAHARIPGLGARLPPAQPRRRRND